MDFPIKDYQSKTPSPIEKYMSDDGVIPAIDIDVVDPEVGRNSGDAQSNLRDSSDLDEVNKGETFEAIRDTYDSDDYLSNYSLIVILVTFTPLFKPFQFVVNGIDQYINEDVLPSKVGDMGHVSGK